MIELLHKSSVSFLVVLVTTICLAPAFEQTSTELVSIRSGQVKMVAAGCDERPMLLPEAVVAFEPGESFGWNMKLKSNSDVFVHEVLELPSPPLSWGIGSNTILNDEMTTAYTTFNLNNEEYISNRWSFSEGDPLGVYKLRVYLNDQLVETMRFEVIAPTE